MLKLKKNSILCCTLLLVATFFPAGPAQAQDPLLDVLEEELNRQMMGLQNEEIPPYHINYRVFEVSSVNIIASFGNLQVSHESQKRILTAMVRCGSPELDNFHEIRKRRRGRGSLSGFGGGSALPLENDPDAIRQVVWRQTDKEYRKAVDKLAKVKANVAVKVEVEDKSPDYSVQEPYVYYEPPLAEESKHIDRTVWEDRMRKLSKSFLADPDIFNCFVFFNFDVQRKYFVSSEGGKIAQNRTAAQIIITGSVKTGDGMVMPHYKSYFASDPSGLPDEKTIARDVDELITTLKALKKAPIVDAYSGPALLSGEASGVFFHEIFGHRVEGQRLKSEKDSQTFKKKVGQLVLPEHMSVYMDPTMESFEGQDLNGFYRYDDEGMKGMPVTIVEKGRLRNFLMSRTPIENFPCSNGHGRAQPGLHPVTRQSNLIVETSHPLSMEQLRKKLIDEAKAQGKEYGYLFENVMGGFTSTGRYRPNAFNVTPTEVYRIYVDGRPDELVRGVDLIGTPLAMFAQIEEAGKSHGIFTGICGAESGAVPVSCVSRAMFIKRIETQRNVKSQERPPILPRPDESSEKRGQS
jgi:predicted Zn-dependent protease